MIKKSITKSCFYILLLLISFSSCAQKLEGASLLPNQTIQPGETEHTPTPSMSSTSLASAMPPPKMNLIDLLKPGSYLIYSSYDQLQKAPYSVSLYTLSSEGSFLGKLTSSVERPLSITPDGKKVAYINHLDGNVYVRDMSSQQEIAIELPLFREFCDGIAWAPDGLQLALACGDIYVSSSPFIEWKSITRSFIDNDKSKQWVSPIWSPQGNLIAYGDPSSTAPTGSLGDSPEGGLYWTEADCLSDVTTCSAKTVHYPASDFAFVSPTWSPDGHYLAFLNGTSVSIPSIEKNLAGKMLLFPHDINGAFVDAISWTPDNQSLTFSYNSDIYKLSLDGSDCSLLKSDTGKVESWIVIP